MTERQASIEIMRMHPQWGERCNLCHYPDVQLAIAKLQFGIDTNLVTVQLLCHDHIAELRSLLDSWSES